MLKQPQRQQLSILVTAGWLDAPARLEADVPRFRLSADVTFSRVLDDGEPTETACASVWTAPTGPAEAQVAGGGVREDSTAALARLERHFLVADRLTSSWRPSQDATGSEAPRGTRWRPQTAWLPATPWAPRCG